MTRGIERSGFKTPQVVAQERRTDLRMREVQRGVNALAGATITQGVLVADLALTTTPQRVTHGLGREPVGVFIVKGQTGAFDIVWTQDTNPGRFLQLAASAGTPTVSVWVF